MRMLVYKGFTQLLKKENMLYSRYGLPRTRPTGSWKVKEAMQAPLSRGTPDNWDIRRTDIGMAAPSKEGQKRTSEPGP